MGVSKEMIQDLKQKCVEAKKKELSFYYFPKAQDGEPALVMDLASEARKAKAEIVKNHKAVPAARGTVQKEANGGGLLFIVTKGNDKMLKKAFQKDFGAVIMLKAAEVVRSSQQEEENGSKEKTPKKKLKVSDLVGKVEGLIKGDSEAFERRLEKVQLELDELNDVLKDLQTAGVYSPEDAERVQGLRRDAADARSMAADKKRQGEAYGALRSVKLGARAARDQFLSKKTSFDEVYTPLLARLQGLSTVEAVFGRASVGKGLEKFAEREGNGNEIGFYLALTGGKLSKAGQRRDAYDLYLKPGADLQINISSDDRSKALGGFKDLPDDVYQDDGFWESADYSVLLGPIKLNIIDCYSRYIGSLRKEASKVFLKASPGNGPAAVKKWFKETFPG